MLLAIDIGNTNLVIGCIENDRILFKARIATDRLRTSDQYGVEIKNMLEAYGVQVRDIDDCIISSVVPPVFNSVKTGVIKILGKQPMVVGPGLKTGLNIHVDVPSQVGSTVKQTPLCDTLWSIFNSSTNEHFKVRWRFSCSFTTFTTSAYSSTIPENILYIFLE